MERYALLRHIQRQRQLVQRMTARQPLLAYTTRQRLLSNAIGPLPEPATLTTSRSWPDAADYDASVEAIRQPAYSPIEQEAALPPAQAGSQERVQVAWRPIPVPLLTPRSHETPESAPLPLISTNMHGPASQADAISIESDPVRQPIEIEASPDQVPVEHTTSVLEPSEDDREGEKAQVLYDIAVDEKHLEENIESFTRQENAQHEDAEIFEHEGRQIQQREQLSGQAGRRRGRIEEQPSLPASHGPATLNPRNVHARNAKKIESEKTEAQQQAESEAAALFTAEKPERSPQEWLALLMQAERKPQPAAAKQEIRSARATASAPLDSIVQPQHSMPRLSSMPPVPFDNTVPNSSAEPEISSIHQYNKEQNISEDKKTPSANSTASAVEPLSIRARTFLRPLLGFDPATAHIHRGPATMRFVEAQRADAVTMGDDVFLATGQANDDPETLGLLAHELTHIARRRFPGFVPPVARGPDNTAVGQALASTSESAPLTLPALSGEEALAEQVEHQVTREARVEQTSDKPAPGGQAWGGLPAPWEPLPAWLAPTVPPAPETTILDSAPEAAWPSSPESHMSEMGRQAHPQPGGPASMNTSMPISRANASSTPGEHTTPIVQRAGLERHQPSTQTQPQSSAPQNAGVYHRPQEPESDLDQLARQVYAVLKRRIDLERRRM